MEDPMQQKGMSAERLLSIVSVVTQVATSRGVFRFKL